MHRNRGSVPEAAYVTSLLEERDQIMVRSDDGCWLARVWRDRGMIRVLREHSQKGQRLRGATLAHNRRTKT